MLNACLLTDISLARMTASLAAFRRVPAQMIRHAHARSKSTVRHTFAAWARNAPARSCLVKFPFATCTCTCTLSNGRICKLIDCLHDYLDSIQRFSLDCEGRSLPFTFDAEAVCGIKLTTSSTTSASATSTSASATPTSAGLTGSQTSSGAPAPTSTPNSAPGMRVMLKAAVIIVAASGILC